MQLWARAGREVSASFRLYRAGTRLLERAAPIILRGRLKRGKEREERLPERLGLASAERPQGQLIWMHGASVGECRLLLDVFADLLRQRPGLRAVMTSQTLTAADMIAARGGPRVVHQMAPVDAPAFVTRFLDTWRPDAAVFAEGEIWPNMLAELGHRWIPSALINARMTQKTLAGWRSRQAAAKSLFAAFRFIGAADQATANGLGDLLHRRVTVVGNLKTAVRVVAPPADAVATWRSQTGGRPILLAASTHAGEETLALDAFADVRRTYPTALLVIAPRHPDRGPAIALEAGQKGLRVQRRTQDGTPPGPERDVLVADTIGELVFWFAASDGVYLGGAHAADVGGHNAIEPVQLGKRVFTGPHGFNFEETFARLEALGALVIGEGAGALAVHWTRCLREPGFASVSGASLEEMFAAAQASYSASLDALLELLPADTPNA
jgi:3-deoxy-D-manno-octulosonic-acid transferase